MLHNVTGDTGCRCFGYSLENMKYGFIRLLFQFFVYYCNINMKHKYIQYNKDGLEYG